MLSETITSKRNWRFGDVSGVDVRGRLSNGNHWRYFGTLGESVNYYDVSGDAAEFFDKILDAVCYDSRRCMLCTSLTSD